MFGDIGGFELIVVAVVALIVIGPKDLPEMFRQLGRVTAKIRSMAREFSRAMEDAAKESGMADAARDMKAATSPSAMGLDKVRAAADKFEKWDPLKPNRAEVKPLAPAPMPAAAPAPAAPVAEAAPAAARETAKKTKAAPKVAAPKATPAKTAAKSTAKTPTNPSTKPARKKADPT